MPQLLVAPQDRLSQLCEAQQEQIECLAALPPKHGKPTEGQAQQCEDRQILEDYDAVVE